jgi:signal transduction histidine kinase
MMRSSVLASVVRVPLTAKLVGANAGVLAVFAGVAVALGWRPIDTTGAIVFGLAFGAALLVTVALVLLAIRPLSLLEDTALKVWYGDHDARVPSSSLADASTRRVVTLFNALLDRLSIDRANARQLAAAVVRSGDEERARTAYHLHESLAQTIATISWHLAGLTRDARDPELGRRLQAVKRQTDDVLEGVRQLAESIYPRVLEHLGLAAALSQLARHVQSQTTVRVVVDVDRSLSDTLDSTGSATLYAVAREAVSNALQHADPTEVTITLSRGREMVVLEVRDDGHGFDVEEAERSHHGRGIFAMRERAKLIDGSLMLASASGGTRVCAYIPHSLAKPERVA